MSRNDDSTMVVGVGWYTPDQYSLLKAFASDPEALCSTFEEWLAKAEETFAELVLSPLNSDTLAAMDFWLSRGVSDEHIRRDL